MRWDASIPAHSRTLQVSMRRRGFRSARVSPTGKLPAIRASLNTIRSASTSPSGKLPATRARLNTILDTRILLTYNQANNSDSRDSECPNPLVHLNCMMRVRADRPSVSFAGRAGVNVPFSSPSHRQSAFSQWASRPRSGMDRCQTNPHPLHLQDGHDFQNFPHRRPRCRRDCKP